MPDHAEPTDAARHPDEATRRGASRRPVKAVLFDFHGTLAQVEEPGQWVLGAAAACGVELDRTRAIGLADRLLTAGRAGGPLPARVPPHLAELWADRDLYEHAHRGAYTGLAATVDAGIDGFAEALYERLLVPAGWIPYPDTTPTLAALREAGVRVAVVSNIGFDIRPLFDAWGLADLVDAFVLSYEVGRCKPDPAIFWRACGLLGVDPEETLMVGDTPADAGAVAAGCAALVLPAADPGRPSGLGAVLDLTRR
ncbi:haloacid dehalogenase superfamily, subfamily IA, variant 3 with third motif having DD or ED/haloacid dehalogenase superfamily, subfamily IA, variant 1 with third motif having Dx(3-4)D or Dx(3-4)E [Micromonospora phaseoli]|uniref:Haloacid dehalogenase superfamily, subfamily IA, variant 3 with third motif having DD or ED/haloacid dehalogenase superfamily, subfamily IA, variant 1 with third motif having Dx(3-4)D or Dx(3-4)E n=1 Tax=Micromonospora phaseoli TaxID=1144548 RepID=A0A1H6YFT7_9ACTN|nr:HAD-IA family hydrolase [Micromonospora phaseoli]PZW00182.1 HAD superfamily hydrolase (TIGR01509 family)/HAD superfamily hydrolase (TIGR01549 family) [Micromonospora phaseoli]SEJ40101.1 haloacid dehalogenase superfamily, subfamily IA, variant 3 with third motif having DD or ED/haloacid dehalogenase superfamily, subfamily IA, variant 1 with third motif having Dx(3-4)D or Dx(3-4)E [Micromonospora phaseoli]